MRQLQFEAIGTHWHIQTSDVVNDQAWAELQQSIDARIAVFDQAYSRFRPDSLVTQMSQAAGSYDLPSDGYNLLQFYEQLYRATDGRVTPLIGQLMSDAGYDAKYSLQSKPLTQPATWDTVLVYDDKSITIKQPILLDFGAAGKGYIVDIVAELLEAAGHNDYVINAGGDIRRRSPGQPLQIALENPADTTEAIGIVQLDNASLCASAGSKRAWGDYHHIIDPVSLQSPRDIIATWVIANDTMTADGLATALFFCEPSGLQHFDYSYAILDKDMNLNYSPNFPVTAFEAAA